MHRPSRVTPGLALVAVIVGAFLALGGCGSATSSTARRPARVEDLAMQPSDFTNLHDMTKVRGFYVDNRLGRLRQALAVANSPTGGTYPVGTILQLVPQEAMVKRRKGFDKATNDWEFFSLTTTAQGTEIVTRGAADVVNRFGGNCAACHSAAQGRFDMVCEHDHGCAPLPVGDDVFHSIQEADPRPRRPVGTTTTSGPTS
jgi:hypothetical protein